TIRGNAKLLFRPSSFNGAALRRARRLRECERCTSADRDPSTEPRSEERGDVGTGLIAHLGERPSTEPRSEERGDHVAQHPEHHGAEPSTEPRSEYVFSAVAEIFSLIAKILLYPGEIL